jgi:hypothetical protein
MRLKLLTNLNTLLLVAVCLALGATLWWSQRALERPYLLMERYLGLSQQFQNEVARNIEDYLASGDALRLSSASQAWKACSSTRRTAAGAGRNLRPSLSSLEAFSKTDLLAAGKLAGDPQALLLQAERELGANLEQLSQYASGNARTCRRCSPRPSTWASCPWPATNWSAAAARNWPPMSSAKSTTSAPGRSAGALPLLGVVASAESGADDFAAMMGLENTEKPKPKTPASASSVNSTACSPATRRNSAHPRADPATRRPGRATHLKIAAVQQAIAGLEPVVRAQHGRSRAKCA